MRNTDKLNELPATPPPLGKQSLPSELTAAFELQRGGLYVLQCECLSRKTLDKLCARLAPFEAAYGVKFLVLDHRFSLVTAPELRVAVASVMEAISIGEDRAPGPLTLDWRTHD